MNIDKSLPLAERKQKLKTLLTIEILEVITEAADVCVRDVDQYKTSFIDWCADLIGTPRTRSGSNRYF